ncbi:MAG: oligosaccharide flippase family protein [Bacteroidales bacterium]
MKKDNIDNIDTEALSVDKTMLADPNLPDGIEEQEEILARQQFNSENNKRIAKNTLMLYLRMMLTMGVSLYTSRVVLDVLGVEDFGICNVVGGVVAMMSFFNSSMSTSIQRFLNYEMDKADKSNLSRVFSTSINAQFLIGIIVLLLAETIGLWFINNKLVTPADRQIAAMISYQCSIGIFLVSIITTPYNALVIAHEKMSFYAYTSIIEVILKLVIVYLLTLIEFDSLALYSILIFIASIFIRISYVLFCLRFFNEAKYHFVYDVKLLKGIFSFSGWMLFGTSASMIAVQGVNILMNIFFGPLHNAARAIAVQIQSAVSVFSTNFMMAVQPQIVKSYARGDKAYLESLIHSSSKYSFFLILILVTPVFIATEYILQLWLGTVPEFTVVFIKLTLIDLLINSLFNPLGTFNQATGKVRNYQLGISCFFLIVFIVSYMLYKFGAPSYTAYKVSIIISLVGLCYRLFILKYDFSFPVFSYVKNVIAPILKVVSVFIFINYLIASLIQISVLLHVTISMLLLLPIIIFIGFSINEKRMLIQKIRQLC